MVMLVIGFTSAVAAYAEHPDDQAVSKAAAGQAVIHAAAAHQAKAHGPQAVHPAPVGKIAAKPAVKQEARPKAEEDIDCTKLTC